MQERRASALVAITKRTPAKLDVLRELAPTAVTVADLARTLGVSAPTVVAWAAIGGIKLPVPAAKRQWRTACPLAGVELPRWVPPHLEAEFWRVAEREDEHAAAARVRKLKAAERVFTV